MLKACLELQWLRSPNVRGQTTGLLQPGAVYIDARCGPNDSDLWGVWSYCRNARLKVQALAADVDHGAAGRDEAWFADVVARFLVAHDGLDVAGEFGVGGAGAQAPVEVVVGLREQAGA